MKYEASVFDHIRSITPSGVFRCDTFEEFSEFLRNQSALKREKPKKGEFFNHKKHAKLISPAIYKEANSRKNANVSYWGKWAALDVDNLKGVSKTQELFDNISKYRYICYSSASSTTEMPKFRIVFDLNTQIEASKIKHFWYAINKECLGTADAQTKDLSRMYYLPANYPNAFAFFFDNLVEGDPINVSVLLNKYDYVENSYDSGFLSSLPPEYLAKLLSFKKSKLNTQGGPYSSWRVCPFVKPHLITQYNSITETGWYNMSFKIMCSIASRAIKSGYLISPTEMSSIMKSIDLDTGGWYTNRSWEKEAERAINFVLLK